MQQAGSTIDVSVLLTTWNSREMTGEAIRSIMEKTEGISYEVIVVDDASSDGTSEFLRQKFPGVRLIVSSENLGFVRANNLGVREARGRYIMLLNTDTILVNNAPGILARFLDDHPDVGVCGGLLLNRDLVPAESYGSFLSFSQALVDAFFVNDLFPNAGFPKRATIPRLPLRGPKDVDYISGADMMVRHSTIGEIGFFDDYFREYCEEVDFCYRLRHETPLRTMLVPDAKVIHLNGMSYGTFREIHIRKQFVSYDKYLTKHFGKAYSVCTRVLYAWHYLVKMIYRGLAALAARGAGRGKKLVQARKAWYMLRFSIAPGTDRP